jgi:hypothetical protein
MHVFGALAVGLLGLAHTVSAHGYLKSIEVGGKSYLAWQVGQDDYVTPEPSRYARRIKDNGPVPDFTTANITCNQGGNIPSKGTILVSAGDKVKLIWDQWGSSHSGPVMSKVALRSCKTLILTKHDRLPRRLRWLLRELQGRHRYALGQIRSNGLRHDEVATMGIRFSGQTGCFMDCDDSGRTQVRRVPAAS